MRVKTKFSPFTYTRILGSAEDWTRGMSVINRNRVILFQRVYCFTYVIIWECKITVLEPTCTNTFKSSNGPYYFRCRIWSPLGPIRDGPPIVALALWSDDFLLRQPWCSKSVLAEWCTSLTSPGVFLILQRLCFLCVVAGSEQHVVKNYM